LSLVFGAIIAWHPAQALSHTALPSAAPADAGSEIASVPSTTANARIMSISLLLELHFRFIVDTSFPEWILN
jgi:hypothetical protein